MKNKIVIGFATVLMLASFEALSDSHAHDGGLPPGLEKKQKSGKPLPPGWQKKLAAGDTLAQDIYDKGHVTVPLGDDGNISITVDGTLIRFNKSTMKIIAIH